MTQSATSAAPRSTSTNNKKLVRVCVKSLTHKINHRHFSINYMILVTTDDSFRCFVAYSVAFHWEHKRNTQRKKKKFSRIDLRDFFLIGSIFNCCILTKWIAGVFSCFLSFCSVSDEFPSKDSSSLRLYFLSICRSVVVHYCETHRNVFSKITQNE